MFRLGGSSWILCLGIAKRGREGTLKAEPTRTRDPEGTKRAVLDAAERLFADRGYEGTSIRDISAASGVSQPLIQHHFGSKDVLYGSVLRRAIEDYKAQSPEAAWATDEPGNPESEMGIIYKFLRENERQLRMIGWARLEGKHELVAGAECLRKAMVQRIKRAQDLGLVRDDIDAASLTVMMEGIIFYWLESRALNAPLFVDCPCDEDYLCKAIAVLERGFAPAVVKDVKKAKPKPRRRSGA